MSAMLLSLLSLLVSNLFLFLSVFGSEKKNKMILVLVTFPVMFKSSILYNSKQLTSVVCN